ncbi:hypothetical protein [Methyloparacoccus murrellii]
MSHDTPTGAIRAANPANPHHIAAEFMAVSGLDKAGDEITITRDDLNEMLRQVAAQALAIGKAQAGAAPSCETLHRIVVDCRRAEMLVRAIVRIADAAGEIDDLDDAISALLEIEHVAGVAVDSASYACGAAGELLCRAGGVYGE